MILTDEMVTAGGPTGPVWAFLTTITLALLTNIWQTVKAKLEARDARLEARKATENTRNVGNGFAFGVDRQLKQILKSQTRLEDKQEDINKALREHLEWHLDKETQK